MVSQWQLASAINTLFVTSGIVILKTINVNYIHVAILLNIVIGISALLFTLCFGSITKQKTNKKDFITCAFVGILFFIGFCIYIKGVQLASNIAIVSVTYYALEISLFILASYFIFKRKTSFKVIIITIFGCSLLLYTSLS